MEGMRYLILVFIFLTAAPAAADGLREWTTWVRFDRLDEQQRVVERGIRIQGCFRMETEAEAEAFSRSFAMSYKDATHFVRAYGYAPGCD